MKSLVTTNNAASGSHGANVGGKTKHKKKRKKEEMEKEDEEERRLTSMIFGTDPGIGMALNTMDEEESQTRTKKKNMNKDLFMQEASGKEVFTNETSDGEEPLFMIDREAHDTNIPEENEEESNNDVNDVGLQTKLQTNLQPKANPTTKPVWQDDDDGVGIDNISSTANTVSLMSNNRTKNLRKAQLETDITVSEYESRQRTHFQNSTTARTDWAKVSNEVKHKQRNDNEITITPQSLLASSKPLLRDKHAHASKNSEVSQLPQSQLNIIRCKDVNWKEKMDATLRSVQFHPSQGQSSKDLLFTAGLDKKLKFFKIDPSGESSEKVHGIFFPDMPIFKASFLGKTGNVVASGRRSYFYLYNAEAGKMDKIPHILGRQERSLESFVTSPNGKWVVFFGNDGNLIIWEVKSKRLVGTLKINGQVRSASFTKNSNELLASGTDGDVYRFDMRTRRCVSRFQNEDGTVTTGLSVSKKFMAIGAQSGIVNLYGSNLKVSAADVASGPSKPLKCIENLQTTITNLSFNRTGEMLALSSRYEKNAFRLFHVPSQTVFSNWPTNKTPLGFVFSHDFSPTSKFIAMGNDKGKCLLYKVQHYE